MKSKLKSKKLIVIVALAAMAVLIVGSWYYFEEAPSSNCISYYDKDGKELLYQDCP